MPSIEKRLELLEKLGNYMDSSEEEWLEYKERAVHANAWFTPGHIDMAVAAITENFLKGDLLRQWIAAYPCQDYGNKSVGIVMAGNIPLVGFHDFICGFMSGHKLRLKLSSKDEVLLKHLIGKLVTWDSEVANQVVIAEQLKNCDAYITTGSNNTARYFEQYFGRYPHIIRRNRTSVAILQGDESREDLAALATDVFAYFGLGCRNVTQVCVPQGYDFNGLLEAFSIYEDVINHNKYKNNYDYHLALYLLNRVKYLDNGSILVVENEVPFSAVSVLHYRYYQDAAALVAELEASNDIQTIVGKGYTAFGTAQKPGLNQYADGVDTMKFLCQL
ncbi:MAG: acyl-CoA reductase [Sphingobacteriales bacterium]|nr:MAG: acyl-CoA reductase [Sphingobacteriales bacterium]